MSHKLNSTVSDLSSNSEVSQHQTGLILPSCCSLSPFVTSLLPQTCMPHQAHPLQSQEPPQPHPPRARVLDEVRHPEKVLCQSLGRKQLTPDKVHGWGLQGTLNPIHIKLPPVSRNSRSNHTTNLKSLRKISSGKPINKHLPLVSMGKVSVFQGCTPYQTLNGSGLESGTQFLTGRPWR